MYATLGDFVGALERAGELARIQARVSPVLEISEITDRVSKSRCAGLPSPAARRTDPRFHDRGGHALLFTNVEGSDFPVLINALGSYRRMEMALGCEKDGFEGIAARLRELVRPSPPRSFGDLLRLLRRFSPILRMSPRRRRGMGLCQEVVLTGEKIDLRRVPMLRCWPSDGDPTAVGWPDLNAKIEGVGSGPEWNRLYRGRYVTFAGIHTIHADDRDHPSPPSHNIGMYRVQLLGPRRMAMHWHMHHDGARHWRSWKALGKPMPVAIVCGGESVLAYAATAPMPPGMSELLLAGLLQGRGIEMVRARTVPLWVPANAEMVIEGFVRHDAGMINYDPGRDGPPGPGAAVEGPFGDHTGYYSLPDRYPILDVTAVTHRREAIFPATIVGLPPQEDYYMGKATERIFLPLLQTIVPDIEDYDLPLFGAFHNCAFVKIRKQYPLHARRVMHAIWGAGQMSWTKVIIVVDDDVDVHDTESVLRAVGERCVPGRDAELVRGPLDILDHAAPFLGAGTKIGLDATRKNDEAEKTIAMAAPTDPAPPVSGPSARACEEWIRHLPGVLDASIPEELGGWWLLVRVDAGQPGTGEQIAAALTGLAGAVVPPPWTLLVGPEADLASRDDALFHWAANISPLRDRRLSVCGRRVVFDATHKSAGDQSGAEPVRPWPPIIRMDEATKALVTQRWGEYAVPCPASPARS
jgi:4-hydroxy-3-polyprenylbenzoate decarboxylase